MDSDRILLHCVSPIYRRQFNLVVGRAMDLQQDGNEVAVTYCDARAGVCSANLMGNPLACGSCRRSAKRLIEASGLKAIPLRPAGESAEPSRDVIPLNGPTASGRRSVRRELLTAVNSNLITQLRMLGSELNQVSLSRLIKRRYFQTSCWLYETYLKVIDEFRPDRIEVVNGRHACSRFPLLAAANRGKAYNVLEYTVRKLPIVFRGHLPHERSAFQTRIKQLPVDWQIAEEYYQGRQSTRYNPFAKNLLDFAPEAEANNYERKVSFFLSSQDECASLGPEWRSPFADYASVIDKACRRFPQYYFCVRFHPHQANMPGDVESPFAEVEKLPNVKIYYPSSTINTYELVAWSDCIVTFGSTVAIEACWMGKPAIQLGPSFYDELDISYTPRTLDECFAVLEQPELQVGNRENAARFAYFELHDHDPIRHLEIANGRNRVLGMKGRVGLGTRLSKQVNGLTRQIIKTYYRLAR